MLTKGCLLVFQYLVHSCEGFYLGKKKRRNMSMLYNNLRIFTPSEQSGPLIPCNSEMVDSSDNSMFFGSRLLMLNSYVTREKNLVKILAGGIVY